MGPLLVQTCRSIFIILIAVVCGCMCRVGDSRLLIPCLREITSLKLVETLRMENRVLSASFFFLLILSFYSLQYRHILARYFLRSIFHTFLCFDSCFGNFPAALRWLPQELLSELHFHTPQFCRKKLLLM